MDLNWIRQQLESKGVSQAELGSAIGLTSVQVNKILTGYRRLTSEEADNIRRFFGYRLPEDYLSPIHVDAFVINDNMIVASASSHEKFAQHNDYKHLGKPFSIERPQWVPDKGVRAAQMLDDSAMPLAMRGDVVFWDDSRPKGVESKDLGRPVVAELDGSRYAVGRLASSDQDGKWSLLSLNPTHENRMHIRIENACRILPPLTSDHIRPVRTH
jgi:transcriptional regulator with XRE-family HTH domain